MNKKFLENVHNLVYVIGTMEFICGIAVLIISLFVWFSEKTNVVPYPPILFWIGIGLFVVGIFTLSWGRIVEDLHSIAKSQEKISSNCEDKK